MIFLELNNIKDYTMKKNQWLTYEEAREFARKLKLKGWKEWQEWSKSGMKPQNIPAAPDHTYKGRGWTNWYDFLGNEKLEWLTFEEAREFARNLNFKSYVEWLEWCKSGMKPHNIPATPEIVYKDKGWKGYSDFLGYEKLEFLSYEEAREFVHNLKLNSLRKWKEWSKSGERPHKIPAKPEIVYKDKGWTNWYDFLGYEKLEWLSYEEAREFVRNLNFKSYGEWREWCRNGMRPQNIPVKPEEVYKDKGWKGYSDFIGYEKLEWLTYEEAREFARNLNFKSYGEWREWSKSEMRPQNIPSSPERTYKGKGWISWGDFIGYEKLERLTYEEVREFARNLNFKSSLEWREWSKSEMRPENIPATPEIVYKDKGWVDWYDFLGYEKLEWLTYEEAREFARNLNFKSCLKWREWSKSEMRPENIPATPERIYKDKGWKGWGDFLGYEKLEWLTFEEARELARNLNFKSCLEWQKWSKSKMRPENIPAGPVQTYKDKGWKGWGDFLGYLGNGNHKWNRIALLTFLEDFKEVLHTCSMAQLFTIIEATGLSPYFTIGMIYDMQETASNSPERIEIVSNIINEIVYGNSDESNESTIGLTEEAALVEAQLSDGSSIASILDTIYDSQLSQLNQIKYLTSLENERFTAALDEERIQFLITESINTLWYSLLNNQLDIEEIKSLHFKGKVPKTIIQTFIKEYEEVIKLKLPDGWTYPHQPLLMQKLIAYRVSRRKRYGNWSSVGSGKTISAILAGRYVGAKNTLVITFNSTIGKEDERGWVKEIRDSFKDSNIYTKVDKNVEFTNDGYNYLILNYETFQQTTSADFVLDLLNKNKFDYIVLDEVQSIKNRGGSISKRRDLILGLINKVKANNPDYYLLAMSATPVINNLAEVKSLIQIIEMDEMEDIDTTETIGNCLQMYRKMTNYGIRYKNVNDNILKGNQYTILDVEADELYPYAASIKNDDFLSQDQLTLRSKLDAVLPYINTSLGKTIIYTHLVKDIDKAICEYLTEKGFKVGLYTGNESELNRESALNEYINGDIDVLVASRPIATGVDGLQKISDRLIILSLPWTFAELIQLIGRINRTGSIFWETGIDVIIPLVSIGGIGHSFRWDYRKYNLITYKKTIANAVVDGIIPKKIVKSKEEIISYADDSISEWIERIKERDAAELKTKKGEYYEK